MLDFTTFEAYTVWKQDQYLREAADDRLLRALRPTAPDSPAARASHARHRGRLPMAGVVATLCGRWSNMP